LTKPSFLLGAVVLMLYQGAEISLWSLAPTLFESIGGGKTSGIISNALIWTMILFGRLFSTLLMRKIDPMKLLLPFGVLGCAALLGLIFTTGAAAIVCAALSGLAFAPFYAFLTTWATEVANDRSSAYLAFIMVAGSIGPIVLGLIVSLFGGALTGGLMALPMLLSFALMMLLLIIFGRHGKEHSHENHTINQ
jgi:fucose permease